MKMDDPKKKEHRCCQEEKLEEKEDVNIESTIIKPKSIHVELF